MFISNHEEEITFYSSSGNYNESISLTIIKPNICPHCNHFISSKIESHSNFKTNTNFYTFGVIFSCPHCSEFFIEIFKSLDNKTAYPIGYSINKIIDKEVPEKIKSFSPKFFEIYSQALTAETNKLFEISGMGFRKSIEFLIKDFLIEILSKPKEEITKLPLQQAINLIDNGRIRTLATASLWLGNDETHYSRKHLDRDTQDMKNFIVALYSFINYELIFIDASSLKKK